MSRQPRRWMQVSWWNWHYADVLVMQSTRWFGQVNGLPSLCVSA
jgi:hypothetical protein